MTEQQKQEELVIEEQHTEAEAELVTEDLATQEIIEEDPIAKLEEQLKEKDEQILKLANELAQKDLYQHAEIKTLRMRQAKEIESTKNKAIANCSKEFITVADNLERALNSIKKDTEISQGLLSGVEMTHKQLLEVLAKFSITPFGEKGDKFDPNQHEAMTIVPDPNTEADHIVEVFQKGYKQNDFVIRPAQVVVAAGEGNE